MSDATNFLDLLHLIAHRLLVANAHRSGFITLLVYLIGGIMYQRIVQQQRGWRQIPNYGFWSGIFGFISDVLVILTSTCARCIPGMGRVGRKGYSRVSVNGNGSVGGRRGRADSEDENRLIDQLDEDWDD